MLAMPAQKPLPLGTKVKRYGTVAGIRSEGGDLGERYYFLIDKHGCIALMPAFIVEPLAIK